MPKLNTTSFGLGMAASLSSRPGNKSASWGREVNATSQASTAFLSCVLSCGENGVAGWGCTSGVVVSFNFWRSWPKHGSVGAAVKGGNVGKRQRMKRSEISAGLQLKKENRCARTTAMVW